VTGAGALFTLLENTYTNGSPSPELLIHPGEGIEPPPGGDILRRIRFVVKGEHTEG
jgi:hypothetical protein